MADHNPDNELTPKQRAFVAAYLGDAKGVALKAARMAGYAQPVASAADNMENPRILARISGYVAENVASPAQVLAKLAEIAFAPSFEFVEVLARDKSGKPVKVRMDLKDQVKALELLGKYHQIFVDRQIVDMNVREHQRAVPQSTLDAMFQLADRPDA
jgi:hypothetical protein